MKTQIVVMGVIAHGIAAYTAAGDDPAHQPATLQEAAAEKNDTSQISIGDRQFLQMAVDRGAREVQLSQQAQSRAMSASVKEFAGVMVEDHSKSNRELLELIEKLLAGDGPPYKQENSAVRREIDALDRLSGAQFDRRYMELMIKDHEAAIEEFGREAQTGQDAQLKALAQKMLPALRRHLEMARALTDTLDK